MKRALVIRNVSSHDVPLDSLDNACVQCCTAQGFITELAVNEEADVMHQLMQTHARFSASNDRRQQGVHDTLTYASPVVPPFDAVLFRASGLSERRLYTLLRMIRTISKQIFLCVFSPQLAEHPLGRYQCFQVGASMVTDSLGARLAGKSQVMIPTRDKKGEADREGVTGLRVQFAVREEWMKISFGNTVHCII
ncbi:hypothetical protein PsorP6_016738 [Peronosclerospora sorghi]|uniref:Uncharacterized protein n=1 Tax=Peronosclerospora sorghi TaxID=230839 RepID=A0ACC0WDJ3_9STRA|nr:hypothetical protein PsorP6_016738 [Peronosclerospora sorghi]